MFASVSTDIYVYIMSLEDFETAELCTEMDTMTMDRDKKESCCDARIVTLWFGIFITIVSSLSILASIGLFVYLYFIVSMSLNLDASSRPEIYSSTFFLYEVQRILVLNGLQIVILVFSLLEFSFDIILIHGATKRMSGHLKAYFIYGNVKSLIITVTSVTLFITMWDNIPGGVALICCGINCVFNSAVYSAYGNIKRSAGKNSKLQIYNISENIEKLKT